MTAAGSLYLTAVLTERIGSKTVFLPGATTGGHHQIEDSCASCHTPFTGVTNDACQKCHADELAAADDSHPRGKFTDPRNANLLTRLDALSCTTCHVEHEPEMTRAMGVTLPDDYCFVCHSEVGKDRPSHVGMAFDTCASAGCHNYHDNTALYEDFLVSHASESDLRELPRVPARSGLDRLRRNERASSGTLASLASDAPPAIQVEPKRLKAWEAAAHARAGINCTGCHASESSAWVDRPGEPACARCHDGEVEGFLRGKHGMRLASRLTPMRPAMAHLPMAPSARDRELSCSSCHPAHDFDTGRAAVTACLDCHDDSHSRAYLTSPHHELWERERRGAAPAESGVSCATCHLPRLHARENGADVVVVQHNQNGNLRPNEKMTRTVCLGCHGLSFSLSALADPRLIANNFNGRPARPVASIEMATRRVRATSH
jgi:formate-dependent nitrite reductase cytochrome c552 subunit